MTWCVWLQGDVRKLTDDIAALKPTVFAAVPRVLERIQVRRLQMLHT